MSPAAPRDRADTTRRHLFEVDPEERVAADPETPHAVLRLGTGTTSRNGLAGRALRRLVASARMTALAAVLYGFLFNLSVVRGSSMAPGIHDGDRILIGPWSYIFSGVERGDVVVLRYPLDPSIDYIKRVVGLPGDCIEITAGSVRVNGRPLEEPYVGTTDPTSYLETTVADGHYFVLGDNRARSSDSRDFGQVPAEYIRGRVDLRLWPMSRIGLVD